MTTAPGRVVALSGPSSAGKTSLTRAFRDARAERGDYWFRIGIDLVLAELPAPWVDVGWPAGPGRYAEAGMGVVDGSIVVGPLLRSLLRRYQRMVAELANDGISVLVDDCILDAVMWNDWQSTLAGLDVLWVAVTAPLDVLARRERTRGDRPIGLAGAQHDVSVRHLAGCPVLDSSTATVDELCDRLGELVDARWPTPPPDSLRPRGPRQPS